MFLAIVAAIVAVWILFKAFLIENRFRFRHLPSPPGCTVFLGHLPALRVNGPPIQYTNWSKDLGGIFVIQLGKTPTIVVTDPKLIKEMCVSKFIDFHDHPSPFALKKSKDKRVRVIRSGLLTARGKTWAKLRAAMNPLFHTSHLQSYAPIINKIAGHLVQELKHSAEVKEPVEMHGMLSAMTLKVIGQAAFGIEFPVSDSLKDCLEEASKGIPNIPAASKLLFTNASISPTSGRLMLVRIIPNWLEPYLFSMLLRMGKVGRALEYARCTLFSTADHLVKNAIAAAKKRGETLDIQLSDWQWWDEPFLTESPYKDLTPEKGSMIDMLNRADLFDYQVAAQCHLVMLAGQETSASTLTFLVHCLASHPEIQAKVVQEVTDFQKRTNFSEPTYDDMPNVPYVMACIKECLRLYPPGHFTTREAVRDVTVGGKYHIPAETHIHIGIYTLHRDPALWPRAEEFLPQRFLDQASTLGARDPDAYMPFGTGPRSCIGSKLALEELCLAVIRIYSEYTFELAPGMERLALKTHGITLQPDEMWAIPNKHCSAL